MSVNVSKNLEVKRQKRFVNKTFEDFRFELENYAKTSFKNKINDFSNGSLGGMLLDFAAIVGDSLTFYTDQQFGELDYETATNTENIVSHLRKAGVKGSSASSSSVSVTFYIEVDIEDPDSFEGLKPEPTQLPIIKKGTTLKANNGTNFILSEDVDFRSGYEQSVLEFDSDNNPLTLMLEKEGVCTSGNISEETFTLPGDQDVFLSYEINNINVQKIISVFDQELNEYYEVDFLSQNTVYLKVENGDQNVMYPTSAPFRFIIESDYLTGTSIIRFGNGSGKEIEDNILTNPEDLILPLKDRNYEKKSSFDPNMLIKNNSLGVSPAGKTITIRYIHGGGTKDNVGKNQIESISNPIVEIPNVGDDTTVKSVIKDNIKNNIIDTLEVTNKFEAVGGTNRMSINELVEKIPEVIKSQSRIVTVEDLLSKIYTMPSDYGRVHKVAILENKYTNLTKDLYVLCKNNEDHYVYANDALKLNLKTQINNYRVLGDSYNIIDAPIYNFGIDLTIGVKANFTVEGVLDEVIGSIVQNMRFEKLQIGEAINVNDILNVVLNIDGVSNIITLPQNIIVQKSFQDNFISDADDILYNYSNNSFSVRNQFTNGFIYPGRGGIFELKYPEIDIVVRNG